MLQEFNDMPDASRIWIYGSDRVISTKEHSYIIEKIGEYLKKWEYHSKPLTAAVEILEDHFIIVALDHSEYGAGGCSIDALQRLIQELEHELQISLFNRLNIFCRFNDRIKCVSSHQLNTIADSSTLFYDLTIQYKHEISSYLKPIKDGWCNHLV